MTQEIFMWVIAIAVLVVFFVNLIVLVLLYTQVRRFMSIIQSTHDRINPILDEAQPLVRSILVKANEKIEPILNEVHGIMGNVNSVIAENRPVIREITAKTNDRTGPILDEVHGIMGNVNGIIAENKPVVHDIAVKANDITGKVNDQATEVRTLMQDTALPKVRDQIERLDNLVKRTSDSIDTSIVTMEKRATRSIQETDTLGAILGVALGVFMRRGLSAILSSRSDERSGPDERRQSG